MEIFLVRLSGYCFRANGEIVSSLVLWKPSAPNLSNKLPYPGIIPRDTGIHIQDLPLAMADRGVWHGVVFRLRPQHDDKTSQFRWIKMISLNVLDT